MVPGATQSTVSLPPALLCRGSLPGLLVAFGLGLLGPTPGLALIGSRERRELSLPGLSPMVSSTRQSCSALSLVGRSQEPRGAGPGPGQRHCALLALRPALSVPWCLGPARRERPAVSAASPCLQRMEGRRGGVLTTRPWASKKLIWKGEPTSITYGTISVLS